MNKANVEIWHSKTKNRKVAKLIATLPLPTHSFVQNGIKLSETHHFWLRIKDSLGNTGDFAYINGECSSDTSAIIESIHGQITKTELAQSLIDSLQNDIDDGVAKSNRNLTAKITNEATKRQQALLVQARTLGTKITNVETATNEQSQQLARLTAVKNNLVTGLEQERQARINGDNAEAQARQTLISQVNTNKASINTLSQTVVNNQQSNASQLTTLTAKVDEAPAENLAQGTFTFDTSGNFKPNYAGFGIKTNELFKGGVVYETTRNWQGFFFNIEQTSRPVVVSFYAKPIQGTCRFCTVSGNRAVKHYSSTGLIKGEWKRYFISFPKGTAFNNTKRQGIVEFVYGRCRYALVKVEYGETPSKFDTNAEKLSSTYTIKTQAIAGNRKAIAGITLGSSIDGQEAESSVILMADKVGVVSSANDGTVKNLFSIVSGKVAVNGDLIADGTIMGKHIKANQTITAPNIRGGSLNVNNRFIVDNQGNLTAKNGTFRGRIEGSTITGGTIRGGTIEGATGTFSGNVYAKNLIDDVAKVYTWERHNQTITIPPFAKNRVLIIPGSNIKFWAHGASGSGGSFYINAVLKSNRGDSISDQDSIHTGENTILHLSGAIPIPRNTSLQVTLHIPTTRCNFKARVVGIAIC
ncbi:DUF1983 domain-containing protein [Phocoenobacter atlanticus subsp. cyclopteri]|nr:DUF1983 domain-containing protein [Pasteurella atlantica]